MDWPFAGRDGLLLQCGELLGSPRTHAFVLAGGAGTGKSRLLAACASRAEQAGCAVFRATGLRGSAGIPFGALAPLLPPGQELVAGGVPLLRQAGDALTAGAFGRPIVLAIDDGHLLDDASSVLIYQLVAARRVFVMATVVLDVPRPDAVTALWRDEVGVRIEVPPLERDQVAAVLAAAFPSHVVAAATIDALTRSSHGNPMVLRELVRGSIGAGALDIRHGLVSLRGALTPSAQLTELLADRLDHLDDRQRNSLELIALGEPLGLDDATALGVTDVEALEAEGLIAAHPSGRRIVLQFAQASIGDLLRLQVPTLRGGALRRRIAERIVAAGARRWGDEFKISLLLLEAGVSPPRDVLEAAAHHAYVVHDFVAVERFARAAQAIEARADTARLLDAALYRQGVIERPAAPSLDGGDDELGLHAMNHAAMLYWHLGDGPGADAYLRETADAMTSPEWRDELLAVRATFIVNSGRPIEALDELAGVDATSGRPIAIAALVQSLALPHLGRAAEALAVLPAGRAAHAAVANRVDLFQISLFSSTEASALVELGRLVDATDTALAGYRASELAHDTAGQAFNALVLGRALLARGRAASALRWLREAMVLFDAIGHRGPARWAVGGVAHAAVVRGELDTARQAIERLDGGAPHPAVMLDADIARANAWLAVASPDPKAARDGLWSAAEACRERNQLALETVLLHDLARLGSAREVVDRMGELTEHVQGHWLPALTADARAIARMRPDELMASVDELARLGADLLAAETATDAAAVHAAAGRQRDAAAWRRRAATLLNECEGARTPRVTQADGPVPLTEREREIALLAAAGLTSKAISDRLYLSVRTVDNNLARVYSKLGIGDRAAIADALGLT